MNEYELTEKVLAYIKQRKDKTRRFICLIIAFLFTNLILSYFVLVASNARYKPIIYLYPTEENEVNVSLGYKDKITTSYPKYEDGWKVLAKLGLTERESEEFIIYWLPKLEKNKYNYIRFATKEEIDTDMPLKLILVQIQ